MKRKLVTIAATVAVTAGLTMGAGQAVAGPEDGKTGLEYSPEAHDLGASDGGMTPLIIGGDPASQKYPFTASLQWKDQGDRPVKHRCTGSLIAPEWVVTAAHCVASVVTGVPDNPADFEVAIGSNNHMAGTVIDVAALHRHPDWLDIDEFMFGADVGLIKLAEPAPVKPVKIARPGPIGSSARMLGWGFTVEGDPTSLPKELRQLDVTLRELEDCQVGSDFDAIEGDICAGTGEVGACAGDSGGPLIQRIFGEWRLIGVLSRIPVDGNECITPGIPDVWNSVTYSSYLNWIREVIASS